MSHFSLPVTACPTATSHMRHPSSVHVILCVEEYSNLFNPFSVMCALEATWGGVWGKPFKDVPLPHKLLISPFLLFFLSVSEGTHWEIVGERSILWLLPCHAHACVFSGWERGVSFSEVVQGVTQCRRECSSAWLPIPVFPLASIRFLLTPSFSSFLLRSPRVASCHCWHWGG